MPEILKNEDVINPIDKLEERLFMADLGEDELYNATTGVDSKDSYNYLDSDVHEEVNDTLVTEHERGKSLNGGVVEAVFRVRDRQRLLVIGIQRNKVSTIIRQRLANVK